MDLSDSRWSAAAEVPPRTSPAAVTPSASATKQAPKLVPGPPQRYSGLHYLFYTPPTECLDRAIFFRELDRGNVRGAIGTATTADCVLQATRGGRHPPSIWTTQKPPPTTSHLYHYKKYTGDFLPSKRRRSTGLDEFTNIGVAKAVITSRAKRVRRKPKRFREPAVILYGASDPMDKKARTEEEPKSPPTQNGSSRNPDAKNSLETPTKGSNSPSALAKPAIKGHLVTPDRMVAVHSENDVLFSGSRAKLASANTLFDRLISAFSDEYHQSKRIDRRAIECRIYDTVQVVRPAGRFLRYTGHGRFVEMTEVEALSCIRTALRVSQEVIVTPHQHDVLLGRSVKFNKHEGNRFYREAAAALRGEYQRSPRYERGRFAVRLVEKIQTLDPPGRFLIQNNAGFYVLASPSAIHEKACQILRSRNVEGKEDSGEDAVTKKPDPTIFRHVLLLGQQ